MAPPYSCVLRHSALPRRAGWRMVKSAELREEFQGDVYDAGVHRQAVRAPSGQKGEEGL